MVTSSKADDTAAQTRPLSAAGPSGATVFLRFRAVLLALVALVIGGLGAATYYEMVRGRERAVAEAVRQTRNLALALEVNAESTFRSADQAVLAVADALTPSPDGVALDDDAALTLMRSQLARGAVFRNLIVTDAAGSIRLDVVGSSPDLTIADRDFFTVHRDRADAGSYISSPVLSRVGRGWFVAVSRRLSDARGAFAGVVVAMVDLGRFERFYASLNVGPNGTLTLWSRDGAALARHPQDDRLTANMDGNGRADHIPRVTDGVSEETLEGPSPVDGEERIVTVRAVKGLPLSVAVRVAAVDFLAEWRAATRQGLLEMLGMSVLVVVLTALLLRHLKQLEATTRALHDSVAERARIEDSLRESEARQRSYLDAAMEGFFVTDGQGRYVDVNRAACQTLGYSREEILGWRVPDVVPDGHPLTEASREGFRTVRRAGLFRGEMVLRHKERGAILADVNAVRLNDGRYLGVIRDVTERRRAEEALHATTSRLTALVRALPDLAFILDGNGVYREVVACADESLLIGPASAIVGQSIRDLMPADPAERLIATLRRTIETGQPQIIEYQLLVPAGARWFEGRTQALPPGFAPTPKVLLLVRDVTERVQTAERLATAKELAEAANQAKGAFLATMSHELRTPLNAIIGFSDIMVHEMFGPLGSPRYLSYAQHIQSSGTHLLDLINDVLDMSKLEAGRYALEDRRIDVMALLHDCADLAAVSAQQGGVTLDIAPAPALPSLNADDRAVRQVVLNLLSNAVKFTPKGGRVTLTAAMPGDGSLTVAVADTGIGIAPEALHIIAEPFRQADNSISRRFGGTGLGLSISRNLMELHGGSLTIDSTVGEGTTVTILFPPARVLAEEATAEAAP